MKILLLVLSSLLFSGCFLRMLHSQIASHGVYDPDEDPDSDEVLVNPVKSTNKSLSKGKKLFVHHCVSCHGLKGRGDGPKSEGLSPKVANLREIKDVDETRIFKQISKGRSDMPNWSEKLKKRQLWELTNYVISINKKKK